MQNIRHPTMTDVRLRIENLIGDKEWRRLRMLLSNLPSREVAELLKASEPGSAILIFRLLPMEKADEVFAALDSKAQGTLIEHMKNAQERRVLLEMPPEVRAELREELPCLVTRKLIYLLPPEEREDAMHLLGYPKHSVGSRMIPQYVAVRPFWTVEKALQHIRRYGFPSETLDMIFVVDDKDVLIDDIPLSDIILAEPQTSISDLMNNQFVSIGALEDQEEAVRKMRRFSLAALPVVNSKGALVGIVTVGEAMDIAEKETTEDFQKKSAIVPLEMSYSSSSVWSLYRKRIVWLALLGVSDLLAASVITYFQDTIAAVVALAFFIPVLIGTGGNAGCQSSTLVIRALAVGDLNLKKWFSVLRREASVGVMLGSTLGAIFFIRILLWKGGPSIGLVVSLSMVCIATWASFTGSLFPIILTKMKLDPAVSGSPLITTFVDVSGLLVYFLIAKWILGI